MTSVDNSVLCPIMEQTTLAALVFDGMAEGRVLGPFEPLSESRAVALSYQLEQVASYGGPT